MIAGPRGRDDLGDGTSEPLPSIGLLPLPLVAPSCGFEPQTTRLTVGGSTGLSYDGPSGHTNEGLK